MFLQNDFYTYNIFFVQLKNSSRRLDLFKANRFQIALKMI